MARVVALLPDLLFGSKVQGMLAAAGHDVTVASSPEAVLEHLEGSELLVVDLCEDAQHRTALLGGTAQRTLAFYLHTDVETRTRALEAGMDLVVPRSRMAREGAALAGGLLAGAQA